MDAAALIAAATTVAGLAGGYWGGRQTVAIQAASLDALQARVADQQRTIDTIPGLMSEISVLKELVTQRANVEEVIRIANRIEGKVDGMVQRESDPGSQ